MVANIPTQTTMTVEQAREVRWPFREIRGQKIGELWDKGAIVFQDLGYAVQRAYSPQVREASRTLLLHALSQQSIDHNQPTGPLNVVESERRSFAQRRQFQYTLLEGFVMGLVMGFLLLSQIQVLSNQRQPSEKSLELLSKPQGLVAIIVVLVALIGGYILLFRSMDWIVNRIDKKVQLHRKGQRGEERLLNAMFSNLDSKWHLFRNLELPGQKAGDIDFVLVGSKGVWAIETKAYEGNYRTVGDQWEKQYGTRWFKTLKSPSKQAKRQATSLYHLLQTNDIKQWINPVVVWANPEANLIVENPAVSIWKLDQLREELNKIQDSRSIPDDQVKAIVDIFKGCYQQPFNSDEST